MTYPPNIPRPEDALPAQARALYDGVRDLPIVSPHGHCDPRWWADNTAFPDPAALLIIPDHYVFRMLYSQGVPMTALGVGVPEDARDPRQIFQTFADYWHCFLGTPSRGWMEHTLHQTLGVDCALTPATAMQVYDQIDTRLTDPAFTPRALFESFNIEVLASTDAAIDPLHAHQAIGKSGWDGRIIPTFRPDSVLDPSHRDFARDLAALAEMTNINLTTYAGYCDALRARRTAFRALGATATDHAVTYLMTEWLPADTVAALYSQAQKGTLSANDAQRFYGHMLIEMAQMSADDGMVMQLHVGSRRNTNHAIFDQFGADMGADIPVATDWVAGLDALLNRVGNNPGFQLILFTLDESTYARELAPMAGHWPCLRIGPPWWFHDSLNGMRRYFDAVVETAGYVNLAGFNDDTRAFLSIPARHDTWRRAVALHLADQVANGTLATSDAETLGPMLCRDLALSAYRLEAKP